MVEVTQLRLPSGVQLIHHADHLALAHALAGTVAQQLKNAIAARGHALLLVSGGRSPVAFFQALAQQQLPWAQVLISLTDERWVAVDHPASNEALVRQYLLKGPASGARFTGLYHAAETVEQAAEKACRVPFERADVLVLGMGEDGHCASLFPGNSNLAWALSSDCSSRVVAMQAPDEPCSRLSLTAPVLAGARHRFLLIQGAAKLQVLEQAINGNDVLKMPIRAFLRPGLAIEYAR